MSGISVDVSGNIVVPNNGVLILENIPGAFTTVVVTIEASASIEVGGDGVQIGETVADPSSTAIFTLDNAGLIETTSGTGQGLDFSQLISPAESITVTNEAGATIQAADGDAILAGDTEFINNLGKIVALSVTGTTNDGIDFQDKVNGAVSNAAGASIEGAEHGITGTQPITVANAGLIEGHAGSGIDMETASGATTTIANTGSIIGNSVAAGPSGDAINVDGLIMLSNSGLIEANGTANAAVAAVSAGGGEIDNHVGGTITSSEVAISIDGGGAADGTGLAAFAAAIIDNDGTIQSNNGIAILIDGDFGDTINNTGAIIGSVNAGGGDDVFNLSTGSSISGLLDGGTGNDVVNLLGSGVGNLASFANIETVNLNSGDWTLGSEGVNDVVFAPGLETLRLSSGVLADHTFSGSIDHFSPGDVIDLEGIGLATGASLGAGNLLTLSGAPGGPVTLQLGAGDSFTGDVFQVTTDNAGGTLLTLGQVIGGGNGNQTLNGSAGSDIINAGNGSDTINGGAGNDSITAGNGNDTVSDGDGNDIINAGNGSDTISAGGGNDIINAANGKDTITVGDGSDTINAGNGNDTISAGSGTDAITLGNGNDIVSAGAGNDTITAGNGNNTISGGAGNDIIKAGNGNNIINGGAGNDILTAGKGNDTFVFAAGFGNDTVTNYHNGDHIEFDDHQFANFAAVEAASHQVGADTVITLDPGDTVTLQHTSVTSLHASDFILS